MLARRCPEEGLGDLLDNLIERSLHIGEILDEGLIKFGKSQEGLDIIDRPKHFPREDIDLSWIYRDTFRRD